MTLAIVVSAGGPPRPYLVIWLLVFGESAGDYLVIWRVGRGYPVIWLFGYLAVPRLGVIGYTGVASIRSSGFDLRGLGSYGLAAFGALLGILGRGS